jgi:Phasin protein.
MQTDSSKVYEQISTVQKTTIDSILRLNEIAARVTQDVTQRQLAVISECYELTIKQSKGLGEIKTPQDGISALTETGSALSSKCLSSAREIIEIYAKSSSEVSAIMEEWISVLIPGAQASKASVKRVA